MLGRDLMFKTILSFVVPEWNLAKVENSSFFLILSFTGVSRKIKVNNINRHIYPTLEFLSESKEHGKATRFKKQTNLELLRKKFSYISVSHLSYWAIFLEKLYCVRHIIHCLWWLFSFLLTNIFPP